MSKFDDMTTTILEALAKDPKDAMFRKVVSDELLKAYREGKADGFSTRQERIANIWEGLVKNA